MRRARALQLCVAGVASMTGLFTGATAHAVSTAQSGGVVLDGWGGLHTFGGFSLSTDGAPYWSGWDIARAAVIRDDGSGGWTLDGWGGVHSFGSAAAISTPV